MDPAVPYNELPLLPPCCEIETRVVLKRVITARDELARLRLASAALPDPTVLINSIPLLEARDSSRIENIVTTSDELFLHQDADASAAPAAKEALRYRTALLAGFESLARRPLSTRTAVEVCSALHGRAVDVRSVPGTALVNAAGEVIYTPPVGEGVIREKLANWERYLHDDDVDVLVRLAVGHYQFEAIHPFTDGNGRTGRILNSLLLVGTGLLDQPTLYLSRYVLEHRDDYYRLLEGVTNDGAWEAWVLFVVDGIAEVAHWTTRRIERIAELIDETSQLIVAQAPSMDDRAIIDVLFAQPYCRIRNLVERGIAQRQTASVYLRRLCEIGVLEEVVHGRDKVFINRAFVDLLKG